MFGRKKLNFSSRGSAPHRRWGQAPRPPCPELGPSGSKTSSQAIGRSHRCPSDIEKKDDLHTYYLHTFSPFCTPSPLPPFFNRPVFPLPVAQHLLRLSRRMLVRVLAPGRV